jgi:two-component system, OmpR family, alkaline phosphatase synthesis response regulator PhoP
VTGGGLLALQQGPDDEVIELGDLVVYPDEFVATLQGERLLLTPKEFQLLALFARRPGRLLRREVIATEVWDGEASGRTIDIHVARLRRRLPKGAIETVIRLGYRFLLQ